MAEAFETQISPDGTVRHFPVVPGGPQPAQKDPSEPDPSQLKPEPGKRPTGTPGAARAAALNPRGQPTPPGGPPSARTNPSIIRRRAQERRRAALPESDFSASDAAFLAADVVGFGIGSTVGGVAGPAGAKVLGGAVRLAARSPQVQRVFRAGVEFVSETVQKIPAALKGPARTRAFEALEASRRAGTAAKAGAPRLVGQAAGAGAGSGIVTAGAEKLGFDPELSPEEAVAFGAGVEGAMRALTPLGGPIGRFMMRLYGRLPWVNAGMQSSAQLELVARAVHPNPGSRIRPGADELITAIDDHAAAAGLKNETLSLGQVIDRPTINVAESIANAAFVAGPLLKRTAGRAVARVQEILSSYARGLAGAAPEQAFTMLESVISGSVQIQRQLVKGAYKRVDDMLQARLVNQGKPPLMVDLRKAKQVADELLIRGDSAVESLRSTIAQYPDDVSFGIAEQLMSAVKAIGRSRQTLAPGISSKLSGEMVASIEASMVRSAEATGDRAIMEALRDARGLSSELHKTFGDRELIGQLMRTQTSDQFAQMAERNIKSRELMQQLKEIMFDPKYAEARGAMGPTIDGIAASSQTIWDNVRGRWLLDVVDAASGKMLAKSRAQRVSGEKLLARFDKDQLSREMFDVMYPEAEGQAALRFASGIARGQATPPGGGSRIFRMFQTAAGLTLLGGVTSEAIDRDIGKTVPVAIILGPIAYAMLARNPALVRRTMQSWIGQGGGGAVAAATLGRTATRTVSISEAEAGEGLSVSDVMRHTVTEFAKSGIPMEIEMSDGKRKRFTPEALGVGTFFTTGKAPEISRTVQEAGSDMAAKLEQLIGTP